MADYRERPFIEKLRSQNIFRQQGGLNPGTPFGMPDLSKGVFNTAGLRDDILNENERERQHELELARMNMKPALPQIAKAATEKPPLNVVYQPSMTDFQKGTLASRAYDRQSRENIASGRLDLGDRQIEGRYGLQGLRGEQMEDQIDQRGENTLEQIDRRGVNTDRQIGLRGDRTDAQIRARGGNVLDQIAARGLIQKDIQDKRGTQGLANIGARAKAAQALQSGKNTQEMPTQEKVRRENAARQLQNTRPDLAEFIEMDDKGNITIEAAHEPGFFSSGGGPTPEQKAELEKIIYAGKPGPTQGPSYDNESVKPGKRKYKPSTIE